MYGVCMKLMQRGPLQEFSECRKPQAGFKMFASVPCSISKRGIKRIIVSKFPEGGAAGDLGFRYSPKRGHRAAQEVNVIIYFLQ